MANELDAVGALAPPALYYAAIDGSPAVDSAVFGALLEKHAGWRNLFKTFLAPAADDPNRLHDPRHPFLPICLHDKEGRQVAVVSPTGRDSKGNDPFWRQYAGVDPKTRRPDPIGRRDWGDGLITVGRHTAAEESSRYMSQLILRPQVELIFGGAGGTQMIGQLSDGAPRSGAPTFCADLLYVSSHGWLGGFARGFSVDYWDEATPDKARNEYQAHSIYFSVGAYASTGEGFSGPRWIVLAQCSTVNSSTWPLWARVLAKSNPHVRGILAYEEASPFPEAAADVARAFFGQLDKKKTFLEAWKTANSARRWAAIVHKEAVNDRLDDWTTFTAFSSVSTTATTSNYRGFLSTNSNGEDIFDQPPPFEFQLQTTEPGGTYQIVSSSNLHDWRIARYATSWLYRMTIRAPAGQTIVKATMQWIHIRPSHHFKPVADKLFVNATTPPCNALPKFTGSVELQILPTKAGQSEVAIELAAPTTITDSRIEPHHSYFWPRIQLLTDKGKQTHDFKTIGISYYGKG